LIIPDFTEVYSASNSLGRCGLDSSDLEQETVTGSCEYGIELSGSIKEREIS